MFVVDAAVHLTMQCNLWSIFVSKVFQISAWVTSSLNNDVFGPWQKLNYNNRQVGLPLSQQIDWSCQDTIVYIRETANENTHSSSTGSLETTRD